MKHLNIINIITLSVATSSFLLAATPTITDVEKSISVPKEVIPKKQELIQIDKQKFALPMVDDKSGKAILIKDFKIDGNSKLSEDELKKQLSEYTNKELTFFQIQEATSILTKYYRQKGYFVARAYIPAQNLKESNGILKISIVEGNYGEFKLTNNSNVKDSIVQAMFDEAKSDTVVSTNTLERSMLIINDTPGVVVTQADVRPGSQVGSSDFLVTTEPSKTFNGYIIADNYGSKYTSVYRTMAGASLNNPFRIGDQLSVSGLVGANTNLTNYRTAYSFPILPNGLRGEVAYSNTNYDLEKKYVSNQEFKGDSKNIEFNLTYPIIRTRAENLISKLSFVTKDMKDKNDGAQTNKKSIDVVNLGFDYTKNALLGSLDTQYNANFTLSHGRLDIKDADAKATDLAGANTDGTYNKAVLILANKTAFTQELSLESSFTYQQALGNKNLDGSEDLSIGGSTGVRVYPDSEESGENGYVLRAEGFYKLPTFQNLDHKVSLFTDTARVKQQNNVDSTKSRQLSDVGLGYYTNYKDFFTKAQLARVIGNSDVQSEADGKDYETKFLIQAGMVF
jgi:hemolysin activation/secretion protein